MRILIIEEKDNDDEDDDDDDDDDAFHWCIISHFIGSFGIIGDWTTDLGGKWCLHVFDVYTGGNLYKITAGVDVIRWYIIGHVCLSVFTDHLFTSRDVGKDERSHVVNPLS